MRIVAMMLAAAAGFVPALAMGQAAVVEAVQYPAWLERGGRAVPLTPGTTLQEKDRLLTGKDARVRLKLPEGSQVKLGENARFVIERGAEDKGIFRSVLSVIAGAFRFTTDPVVRRRRDVSIKVKNVTAGIRGTDVWGKSTDEKDLVCLIEGRVSVGAKGHPTVTLDQPLDFYQKPRDRDPEVAKVDAAQLEAWGAETEVAKGGPVARAGGTWRVVVAVFPTRDQAMGLARTLRNAGYPAGLAQVPEGIIVQITGLAGEDEARGLVAKVRGIKGVQLPSVHDGPL